MKKFLIFCAISVWLCLWSRAQFNFFDQAFLGQGTTVAASPGDLVQQVPGIYAYWNATDLTNGASVSNWVDRIQGLKFQQTTAGNMPTNSSSGVYFDAGGTLHYLDITNNGLAMLTNATISSYSIAISVKWDGHDGFDHVILSDTNAANTLEGNFYYHEASPTVDKPQIDERYSINTWAIAVNMPAAAVDIFIPTLNNGSYTNNVVKTDNFPLMFTNLTRMGTDRTKSINWNGAVAALAIFTNQLFTSATIRSNIHYQWTNQFNYAP